jgi:hypothetical protein
MKQRDRSLGKCVREDHAQSAADERAVLIAIRRDGRPDDHAGLFRPQPVGGTNCIGDGVYRLALIKSCAGRPAHFYGRGRVSDRYAHHVENLEKRLIVSSGGCSGQESSQANHT